MWKTKLKKHELWEAYQKAVQAIGSAPLSINTFLRVCKENHVHFGQRTNNEMNCVLCRELAHEIEAEEEAAEAAEHDGHPVKASLRLHRDHVERTRIAVNEQARELQPGQRIVVLDWSNLDLDGRCWSPVLCACVIQNDTGVPGAETRHYYDFLELRPKGRKRDALLCLGDAVSVHAWHR